MQKAFHVYGDTRLDEVNWHLKHGWKVTNLSSSSAGNSVNGYFVLEGNEEPPRMPEKPAQKATVTNTRR